ASDDADGQQVLAVLRLAVLVEQRLAHGRRLVAGRVEAAERRLDAQERLALRRLRVVDDRPTRTAQEGPHAAWQGDDDRDVDRRLRPRDLEVIPPVPRLLDGRCRRRADRDRHEQRARLVVVVLPDITVSVTTLDVVRLHVGNAQARHVTEPVRRVVTEEQPADQDRAALRHAASIPNRQAKCSAIVDATSSGDASGGDGTMSCSTWNVEPAPTPTVAPPRDRLASRSFGVIDAPAGRRTISGPRSPTSSEPPLSTVPPVAPPNRCLAPLMTPPTTPAPFLKKSTTSPGVGMNERIAFVICSPDDVMPRTTPPTIAEPASTRSVAAPAAALDTVVAKALTRCSPACAIAPGVARIASMPAPTPLTIARNEPVTRVTTPPTPACTSPAPRSSAFRTPLPRPSRMCWNRSPGLSPRKRSIAPNASPMICPAFGTTAAVALPTSRIALPSASPPCDERNDATSCDPVMKFVLMTSNPALKF